MSRKTQRLVDLLAALLAYHAPRSFAQIVAEVPEYQGKSDETQKRTFERDKKALREFGVPLETVGTEGAEDSAYRIRSSDFYLPYLALVTASGTTSPRKVSKQGYRALATLAFEADELAALTEAAHRVRALGDPALAEDVESAMRKLAFDLPVDGTSPQAEERLHLRGMRADPVQLELLAKALMSRKRVRFEYHAMHRDTRDERQVEPYGLFFLNGHWYLAARDVEREALRNYRVSRISGAAMPDGKQATADYEIPADFSLREHSRSRQAWELGDGGALEAVVEFRGSSGAARAGAELGEPVEGEPDRRRFRVRRPDAFARWVLSFAGEAVPVEPPEVVRDVQALAAATRAVYPGVLP